MNICKNLDCHVYIFSELNDIEPYSKRQGRRGGGVPGVTTPGPGPKRARTQTVTNLQVLQDMK